MPFEPVQHQGAFTQEQIAAEQAAFMTKVYGFMAAGLAATGTTAWVVANTDFLVKLIFGNVMIFYGLLIAELAMVWTFSSIAKRVSALAAIALFLVYAITNGLTLSVIFLVYTTSSIETAFFVTAGTFGGMTVWGLVTKRDLTGLGHFAMMGLFGLILAMVVNLFLGSEMIYWLTTCAGVLIFTALTAYDTQKIKEMNIIGNAGTDEDHKEAVHGALILYLDFINLLLFMLRVFGRRR
jgi:hypothetical protein